MARVPESEESILDHETRERIAGLSIRAKQVVDGLVAGMHRSPHRGASVVFVEHREYRPGDDPRLLDWRAFARSDRHTVKRFEQETQLAATLVLDCSASMDFGEDVRKIDCARTLLAAIALLLQGKNDAAGVARITDRLESTVPARARAGHLDRILRELAAPVRPDAKTDLLEAITAVAERVQRRGLIVLASDLLVLDEHGALDQNALRPLDQLVHHGHDVWVFQVLTPTELELDVSDPTRFLGAEGEPSVDVDPEAVRTRYRREIENFIGDCRARCTAAGARYRLVRTDEKIERVLGEFVSRTRERSR